MAIPLSRKARRYLFVACAAPSLALGCQLVAGIDTKYDPVSLMRVVMIEHARSSIEDDSFDLSVLEKNPGFFTLLIRCNVRTYV